MKNAFIEVFNRHCISILKPIGEQYEHKCKLATLDCGVFRIHQIELPYHWFVICVDNFTPIELLSKTKERFKNDILGVTSLRSDPHTMKIIEEKRREILNILNSQDFIDALAIETIFPTQE